MGNLERTWEEIEQYRKSASDSGDFNVSAAYEKSMDIISNHMNDGWIPVEECRKAVEKQKPKPCEFYGDEENGKLLCPNCGEDLWDLKECGFNNCPYCGQAIGFEESEEE